ncbi:hypothetical protein ABS768_04960 [Flavobacterium sp. ST-75]|uniref:DUF5673 domain-containing protein n=1 Tax=Flavobacterium rhizophilum TaxID=3163296 RepID=A0ABW8YAN7_9FLAO
MKDFFKYRFGYINIDDENLYLNETGNWSYVEKLKEKKKTSPIQRPATTIIYKLTYLLSLITIVVFLALYNSSFINGIIVFFVYASIYYFIFEHLNIKIDYNYKIPLHKINSITQKGNTLEINFLLKHNTQTQTFILDKIEPRGFDILRQRRLLES